MKSIEKLEKNKCRTCYNATKGLKLLTSLTKCGGSGSLEQKSYAELLREISNINIMEDSYMERLPQSICESCARRLKAAHSFIEHAQEVNEKLLSIAGQLETTKHLNCLQEPSVDILPTEDIKVENDDTEFLDLYEPQCFVELKVEEPEQSAGTQIENTNSEDILSIKNDEEAKEINKSLKELSVSNQSNSDNDDDVDSLKSPSNKDVTEIDCNSDVDFSSDDDKIDANVVSEWKDKKKTSSSQNLKEHKKSKGKSRKTSCNEDDDVAVPCNECHKIFSNAKKLARHKSNTHIPEDQKCTCPICGRRFSRSCNMYTHMRSFHGPDTVPLIRKPSTKERIFQCDKCDRNYIKKSHLKVHIKEKHSKDSQNSKGSENEATEQPNTTQQNSGDENLAQESTNTKKTKRYEVRSLCSVCGSSFASRTHLIVHMRRHTGERPFKCDLCERAYPRLSELVCHRRIHTGEKPFKCKICDKAFRVSSKMSTHMRSHTDIRPYKCTQCERSFKYSKDLNIHFRIHTGERPYRCNVCGSTFTQTNTLKAHRLKLGHMEEPTPINDNIG